MRAILGVAALLILFIAAGVSWWLLGADEGNGPAGDQQSHEGKPASPSHLDDHRAEELAASLTSGDARQVKKAMAVPERVDLSPDFVEQLSELRVEILTETFEPAESGNGATVRAAVGGLEDTPAEWILHLALIDGEWSILDTTPTEGDS